MYSFYNCILLYITINLIYFVVFGALKIASQEIHKEFQHFDSGQNERKSDTFCQRSSTPLNTWYDYSNSKHSNDNSNNNNNEQSQSDDIDEARYNLATHIMSNGVEVIIASDKTKTPDYIVPDISNNQLHYNKPMTLAASTIKNQMMILLLPSSGSSSPTDNNFVVNPSSQQLNYNVPLHKNHFITKTCLTTYTYRTTYVQEGHTTVESREKVISNIATEERNYPKIAPTRTIGVTLTKTPELAVGIFPTTYSYFNTFKDDNHKLQVMTSEYTVVNTVTGPNDYIAYLQPTPKATAAIKTNTYYSEVTLTQKIISKMHTIKRNLTQVIVTQSYTPAYSTVLTSYYTYDDDTLEHLKDNLNLLKTSLALDKGEKEKEKLNEYKTRVLDDIHIYTTKTCLTTFTYYTTTVLNSYLSGTNQKESDIKPMSTVFNYYTRVIENVITDSVPTTLLPNKLLAEMKIELRNQKPNKRRRLIVTTATLKNGQTLKISAMEVYKGNLASASFNQTPPSFNVTPAEESLNHTHEETEDHYNNQENDDAIEDIKLQGSLNSSGHLPFLENVEHPENQEGQEDNNGFSSLPSEQILTFVEAPNKQPSNANTSIVINDKPSTSATNQLIQRLTALKPMFSVVAGLLKNNFGVTRETIKPITNIESKQSSNKKINSSATNSIIDTKHPIYIPVPKSPIRNNPYEIFNNTEFIPQSLHINPPLLINEEDNNFELNDKENTFKDKYTNIIPLSTFTIPRHEQPLHNGGIYIRPGEIITANSDVIVGKPNGIEYVKIPNQVYIENFSKAYPLDNRQYQVTYYHNKVQHPYKKKSSSELFTSITHKPQHVPVVNNGKTNNKLNPQPTLWLRPPNEQHFNKNILTPPPPPSPAMIQSSIPVRSQQWLSLMLTAPDKPVRKQPNTTNAYLSSESAPAYNLHSPPLLATPMHKISEFSPSQTKPSSGIQKFYNFNNDLKNNEVLEVQQNKQGLDGDFKLSSMQNPNLSNLFIKPQAQYYMSSGDVTTVTEKNFDKKQNPLNWQSAREPLTLTSYMRLQPKTNVMQPEKDQVSSEFVSKHTTSSNWKNDRKPQTKTSASYIKVDQKPNFGIFDKNSKPEVALTGSSSVWNLQSVRQTQASNQLFSYVNKENPVSFLKFQHSAMNSNQQKRRPAAVSSTNVADMKVFFKTLLTVPNTKPPSYYPSSNSLLHNEKVNNYSNESVTKNHQNVSLDQHIFSHTVDVNVPPLTFNREDLDYPQHTAKEVRGQISPASVKELNMQAKNVYKYMPLITIPANKEQVQVSLTPLNSIIALTLPLEVSNESSWNTVTDNNDDNSNHTVRKIYLHNDNFRLFRNDQDQKTFATNNVLNSKPKPEVSSNWKHHRRQQLPVFNSTKIVNTAKYPTEGKKSKTEQHFRSTLKPKRKDQQTKLLEEAHLLSRKAIQPIIHIPTDLEYSPQTPVNELKTVVVQPSHIEPTNSDCLVSGGHNGENEQTRTQEILAIKESSKEKNHANRVAIQKTDSITTSSKTPKITTATTWKSETTAEDINEIVNLNKKADEANQAPQIIIHGEPFKKLIQNNWGYNKESFAKRNNQTKTALFIIPGEALKTATSTHNANVKMTYVKLELPPAKGNLSTEQNLLDTEVFVSRETQDSTQYNKKIFNTTPTKISTQLKTNTATTETVFGLHPPPLTTSTHSSTTSTTTKKGLPDYSLSNSNEKTYEVARKRLTNKTDQVMQNITGEMPPQRINYANTTSAYKIDFGGQSQVIQPDESFQRQSMVTIKTVSNKENAKLQNNLSLPNIRVMKHYENERRRSNENFKVSNLQPSESYEGKRSITMTSPLATSTLTFTTTIKRIILPTKYITNKRVYTVTSTAAAPKLQPTSSISTYLQSTSFLSTTETTTEVTTLFLTHTKINTIIDTVTSVKTLEPITITATTTVKHLATESTLMELSTIKSPLSDLANNNSFASIEAHAHEGNQDLTYFPYPSVEVVSTNISQESTLNPNENSIFIIMTNNKNKNNTVFTHHSTSQIDRIPQDLQDNNNIGQIDERNEVMIEYDNGISFDDISIREEELPQFINRKSVASFAFVNNEALATKGSSDDHIFLGGVLIPTPPKLPTKHLSSNQSTNASCQPKCWASRNEQCVLNDNNWSCFCRIGFARMFPDRSCKPMYTYELLMHAERIGSYPLQYVNELKNNKTEHYKQLSQLVNNALDRMVMQSDFRDAYHGVEVTHYSANGGRDYHGIMFNVLLQLSHNSNEKRLEEVFKKKLRLSNYSIGGTDLYTNKAGVNALIVKDFNECTSRKLHDCSENAHCFNLPGTYTCSCMVGFADLSGNPIYPGRICSSEQIGCEMCHYHGKCSTLEPNSIDRNYCECFPWYAGSRCQVNLKIMLILLLGIGTLLFILLLFCILITCTKRPHNHLQHAAPSTMTTSSEVLQNNSQFSANMVLTSVGLRNSFRDVSLKNNKRQELTKIEKRLMIKDSSSETSQNSLPFVLKNRDFISESCNKKKICVLKHSKKYRNCGSQGNTIEQYSVSVPSNRLEKSQSDLNAVIATSSSLKGNGQQTEQQILLGNATEYEGHYCEQSDRSLTVMIPRAKYHSSVMSQTQLMHHQLTMERVHKTSISENNDKDPELRRNYKKKLSSTREITNPEKRTEIPANPGALISAGFEVSAVVGDNTTVVDSTEQQHNDLVNFDSLPPNYTINTISDPATSIDSNAGQKHLLNEERQQCPANKNFSTNVSDYNHYKCEKDLIETMDEWLGNVKLNELSAEARSFDETTIRASTKPLRVFVGGTQTQLHDEVNAMTERDIGSTFLLPHTHLYKPERQESELSWFDSF